MLMFFLSFFMLGIVSEIIYFFVDPTLAHNAYSKTNLQLQYANEKYRFFQSLIINVVFVFLILLWFGLC
jgi:uncharacterized membrane protein SpoIIM required for sporulation